MLAFFLLYVTGGTMERALNVVKYIIAYCATIDRPVSNLQVQRILFFCNWRILESLVIGCLTRI